MHAELATASGELVVDPRSRSFRNSGHVFRRRCRRCLAQSTSRLQPLHIATPTEGKHPGAQISPYNMPAPPPIAYSTLSSPLPSRPYILSIHPSSTHLVLAHPSPSLTLADPQTLQAVDTLSGAHDKDVSAVWTEPAAPGGAVWSAGHDGRLVRWDERTRGAGAVVRAQVRGRTLPLLSVAAEGEYAVMGGTELVSSEAHVMFWSVPSLHPSLTMTRVEALTDPRDTRNTSSPSHIHSSTHSDDITSLSLLPPSRSFLSSSTLPIPPVLLLSASTDGLLALSDPRQTDEDEALLSSANWGVSVARAGSFVRASPSTSGGPVCVWARSDIDSVGMWEVGLGKGDEGEDQLEMTLSAEEGKGGAWASDEFKFREFDKPQEGPRVAMTAQEERQTKDTKVRSDYLAEVLPSLGVSKRGGPMVAVGNNEYVNSLFSPLQTATEDPR